MCGIYGVLSKNRQLSSLDVDSINSSFKREMGHRGPDDSGFFTSQDSKLLLGHLRLSIIDIDNGMQPMMNVNDAVVFNGEIYNFEEIKEKSLYNFVTLSDTEVILSEYQDKGESFCDSLNGMYGIALYNSNKNTLTLSVDPLGIKSIYIFENDDYLVFSSELVPLCKYIKTALEIMPKVDLTSSAEYLYHGMFLNDNTPVQGIRKMLPGTIFTQNLDDKIGKNNIINYKSNYDTKSSLNDMISAAVKRQLVADVPLCLFLSGGIDSSLLAATLVQQQVKVKCYTFSFDESSVDESVHAMLLAEKLGLECELVKVDSLELIDSFKDAVYNMDEPISDFASIPLSKLSQVAGTQFKVCLLGDGGDELFYGYTHHKYWGYKVLLASSISSFFKIPNILDVFSYKFEDSKYTLLRSLALLAKLSTPYSSSYGPFSNCSSMLKIKVPTLEKLNSIASLLKWEKTNSLNRKLLQKTDRVTMREGLEARVPLLDLELVNFSARYKPKDCIKSGKGKIPLRQILSKCLPKDISNRKKQGFRTPAAKWLRGPLGGELLTIILNCETINLLISRENIKSLFDQHQRKVKDNSSRILSLYALAMFWNKCNG